MTCIILFPCRVNSGHNSKVIASIVQSIGIDVYPQEMIQSECMFTCDL